MLGERFPVTSGKAGSVEVKTPVGGQISVLGLRANGSALTTIPVISSDDSISAGSFAHMTFNGDFESTFYIVRTKTANPAPVGFALNFFDEQGSPMSVPLFLPQSGTSTVTSSLSMTLTDQGPLVVQTKGVKGQPPVVGSAQLTTTSNGIGAFEVFRWNTFGQEASVPLETRIPNSFVLVFDNTGNLSTGVAVANVSSVAANITVQIRDEAGTLLDSGVINIAPQGHTSFMLPNSYSKTVAKRGTAEFIVPTGGQISVIGLRATSDGRLTTIPLLTK